MNPNVDFYFSKAQKWQEIISTSFAESGIWYLRLY
ncbi:hypothetical protein CLV51_103252 [Chitinophaga niastensis]|uniref:Uncharacterized protein n=1 Tax=Chitinophaga niastensis TaxID=536980 RepID=A0A2P8HJ92_CHINA|nr:hypothetical protein CLV51_103252 [Chitinophaga niastensis]